MDALIKGRRGLDGENSVAKLKEELGWKNPLKPDLLDIDLIKQSILAHKNATGEWPIQNSGMVEYDHYKDKETWFSIHSALFHHHRGLSGEGSLARLKMKILQGRANRSDT